MVRDCWLLYRQSAGEVTDANVITRPRQRSENRKTMRIGQSLEQDRVRLAIGHVHLGRRAATLYRHSSILNTISAFVNAGGQMNHGRIPELWSRQVDAARSGFQQAITCPRTYAESAGARAELRRLTP